MKKELVSKALATLCIAGLGFSMFSGTAFAAYSGDANTMNTDTAENKSTKGEAVDEVNGNTVKGDVVVKVKGKTNKTTHVYGVTYDKTELTFEFTADNYTWNPETLVYDTGDSGTWSAAQAVTIKNYSDFAIGVEASFDSGSASGTTATYTTNGITVTADFSGVQNLAAANATATPAATSGKINVSVSGTPVSTLSETATTITTMHMTVTKK